MDPLSITASVIAVASLAATVCHSFASLRETCKTLPGRLHALIYEASDFRVVCRRLEHLSKHRADLLPLDIDHLLIHAQSKPHQLKEIMARILALLLTATLPCLPVWKKEQFRLQELQGDIKAVKASINIMRGAAQS